jgi:hypothetical protein
MQATAIPGRRDARTSDGLGEVRAHLEIAEGQELTELRARQLAVLARLVERALDARR